MRFALGPDRLVTPDVAAKLPGRGVWVRADRTVLEQGIKRQAFNRGFKGPCQVPADLSGAVAQRLFERSLDLLGLARRAGAVAIGAHQVEAEFRRAPPLAWIEASDGAEEGREKLRRLVFGLWGEEPKVVGCFTAAQLGVALGRDHVVHACLLQERMAHRWMADIGRLSGFSAITPASWRTGPDPGGDATPR